MSIITTIEDLRVLARRRVPRMFYDYADAGSWTESTYRANEEDFAKILPVRRTGVPEDIASACAWLCQDDAGYVTGQTIGVNGGRIMS